MSFNLKRKFEKLKNMGVKIWSIEDEKIRRIKPKEEGTFYSTVRPITILCKILGTFTIKNVFTKDARLLQYKFLSLDTLWSPILHLSSIYILWKYGTFPWWITPFPVFAFRAFSGVFLCVYYDRFVLDFIVQLEEFDYLLMLATGRQSMTSNLTKGINWMITTLAIFSASLPGAYLMLSSNPQRTPLKSLVESTVTLVSDFAIKSFIMIYLLFCMNLSSRFDDVFSHLRAVISRISSEKSGRPWVLPEEQPQCGSSLEEIRVLYEHLAEAVRKLNGSFGAKLAIHMALCFVQLVLDFYQSSYDYDLDVLTAVGFFLYHVLSILVMGAVTECVPDSVSANYSSILCKLKMS